MMLKQSNICDDQFVKQMLDLARERKELRDVLFEEIGSELMAMKLHLFKAEMNAEDKIFLSNQLMNSLKKIKDVSSKLYPIELKELGVINTLVRLCEHHYQLNESLKVHAQVNDLNLLNDENFFILLNHLFLTVKKMISVQGLSIIVDEVNRLLLKFHLNLEENCSFEVDQLNMIQKQFECVEIQFDWISKKQELEIAISFNERGN